MSRAIPGGRSVVTLHGPSLAWRSASARRWRTESSVQASLRTIAECMASASESETRVMGIPKAWAHDTTVTTRTARFPITDCTGYQVGEAGKAGALSPELRAWWGGPPVRGRRPRRPARTVQHADPIVPAAERGRPGPEG